MTEPIQGDGSAAVGDASAGVAAIDDPFDALLREAARGSAPTVTAAAALGSGTELCAGRLRVVAKLGEGGMGVVYEAFDQQRRERVALKTLSRLNATSVYRLKNEFRALADVRHDNLVALHELFNDGELWAFTMERVEGERFDAWVRPRAGRDDRVGVLDEGRLRAALPQLVEAVRAVHAAGKLHRDLKPSNVLVTSQGRVVVLDFGLAIDPELGGVGQTVAEQGVSGTPGYMAPEQAAGQPATAASDFYAIGVMLFEALTGRLPFEGRAHEQLVDKQRQDAPRAGELVAGVATDLDALCASLLRRVPAERGGATELLRWCEAQASVAAGDGSASGGLQHSAGGVTRASLRAPVRGLGAPSAAGTPRLLGRDRELVALREAFAATLAGKSVVLFVSGESGMGKSALCEAFADALRAQGRATVLQGRCYERENVPFKGFDALVDDLSRHLRRLPAAEAAALMPREVFALARVFPVLDRISAVADAPKKQVIDPQDLKRRAFEAFGELIGRMRDRAPLVVLLDDVQWIDTDSMRFMRALLVHPEPAPVLLLCAHRSEGAADNALLRAVQSGARDNLRLDMRELEVGPLAFDALQELTARLLHAAPDARDAPERSHLAAALANEAQGSPFFAGELARAATQSAPDAAPPSLDDALALHVASLPEPARRLLTTLALVGQPIDADVVIDACEIADGHGSLDRLRAEQLVRVSLHGGTRSIECYHDKIRERLAARLDVDHARQLALGVARALQARGGRDAELLSRCLTLADQPGEAATHAARAAEAALRSLAFAHAVELYAQALAQPEAFDAPRLRALRLGYAEALACAGRGESAGQVFGEIAAETSDDEAAELWLRAAEQYLYAGNMEQGRTLLDRCLRGVGHRVPQSTAAALASVAWSRGRLRLRRLELHPRTGHAAAVERELEYLGRAVYALVGTDHLRAADLCARQLLRAMDVGHAGHAAQALAWELLFACMLGAPDERVEAIDALGRKLSEVSGNAHAGAILGYSRGIDCFNRRADIAGCVREMDAWSAWLEQTPDGASAYSRAWCEYWKCCSAWALGHVAEATTRSEVLLEDQAARGDRSVLAPITAMIVFGSLGRDRPDLAHQVLAPAQARLERTEVTGNDMFLATATLMLSVYEGHDVPQTIARVRGRLLSSFYGRFAERAVAAFFAGCLMSVAQRTNDSRERRKLLTEARAFALRARKVNPRGFVLSPPDALLALLDDDRSRAIATLRAARHAARGAPLLHHVHSRRLGELLGDAEGAALVAEADAFMRAGRVVDPERYARALSPGLEWVAR